MKISRNELKKVLETPEIFLPLKAYTRFYFGEEVTMMIGYNQNNPHHCFDLFEHSLQTVAHINTEEVQTSAELLRLAAFLHDVGKPAVMQEKDGRQVYYGHPQKSAEIAEKLLRASGEYDEDDIALVSFFVAHHDDFVNFVSPSEEYPKENPYLRPITHENVFGHILSNPAPSWKGDKAIWNDLILLCKADASSQSETVFLNGVEIPYYSKKHKLYKLELIQKIIK